MTRSLRGDEAYLYRGVVVWRRPDGESVRKYVGPFTTRVAALQAANREIGSGVFHGLGVFHGWDENDVRVRYELSAKFVERAPLAWERWEES